MLGLSRVRIKSDITNLHFYLSETGEAFRE